MKKHFIDISIKEVIDNFPHRYVYEIYINGLPNRMSFSCVEFITKVNTGELGYDGLNGTRKIGPSYTKSVVYI